VAGAGIGREAAGTQQPARSAHGGRLALARAREATAGGLRRGPGRRRQWPARAPRAGAPVGAGGVGRIAPERAGARDAVDTAAAGGGALAGGPLRRSGRGTHRPDDPHRRRAAGRSRRAPTGGLAALPGGIARLRAPQGPAAAAGRPGRTRVPALRRERRGAAPAQRQRERRAGARLPLPGQQRDRAAGRRAIGCGRFTAALLDGGRGLAPGNPGAPVAQVDGAGANGARGACAGPARRMHHVRRLRRPACRL
jgi:hypothetical protein